SAGPLQASGGLAAAEGGEDRLQALVALRLETGDQMAKPGADPSQGGSRLVERGGQREPHLVAGRAGRNGEQAPRVGVRERLEQSTLELRVRPLAGGAEE